MSSSEPRIRLEANLLDSPREFLQGKLEGDDPDWNFLSVMEETPAGPEEYHKEGSVLEHSIRVTEEAKQVLEREYVNPFLIICAFFHDIGKIKTDEDKLPSHPCHEKLGEDVAREIVSQMGFSAEEQTAVGLAARMHMRMNNIESLRNATLLRTVQQIRETSIVSVEMFLWLSFVDSLGREPQLTVDISEKRKYIEYAIDALQTIDVSYIVSEFDVSLEETEKIEDLLLQERIEFLKDRDFE